MLGLITDMIFLFLLVFISRTLPVFCIQQGKEVITSIPTSKMADAKVPGPGISGTFDCRKME